MAQENIFKQRIIVTGDFTIDWNIAHLKKSEIGGSSWNPDDWTRARASIMKLRIR